MHASCETLFEIMDDLPGVLKDDGKGNAICHAIVDSVLRAIEAKDEEYLIDYHRALSRVLAFVRAQDKYSTDERLPFLAGRLCGWLDIAHAALERIVPPAVIEKIMAPKNVALILMLQAEETELSELAAKIRLSEEELNDLLAELSEVVVIQTIGQKKFARLSLVGEAAIERASKKA